MSENEDSRHFHEWIATDQVSTYTCTKCELTTTGCSECNQPLLTALTICDRCLNRAKAVIQDVIDALNTTEFHAAETHGLRAIRYDRARITESANRDQLPFGLDRIIEDPEDTRIEAAKHPDTAVATLYDWADAWADTRGDNPSDPLPYLINHTLWAMQNQDDSAWPVYIDEAKKVRRTIRRLLGINPEEEAAPCVHCGGTIIREWLNDGLDDTRRCTGCALTWPNEQRLAYANLETLTNLPTTHADTLVTIEEAKIALPHARRGTLDTWARRGRENPDNAKFPTRGRNVRGHNLYRLGDIRDAWDTRPQKLA